MTLKSVNPRNLQQVGELIHHTSAEAIKLIVSKAAAVCADFDASTLNQRVQLLELLSQKLEQKRPEICQYLISSNKFLVLLFNQG